jgi:hypothetical protein
MWCLPQCGQTYVATGAMYLCVPDRLAEAADLNILFPDGPHVRWLMSMLAMVVSYRIS